MEEFETKNVTISISVDDGYLADCLRELADKIENMESDVVPPYIEFEDFHYAVEAHID